MPGASSPWVDQWAPAQYVFGGTGGAGPVRSPDADSPTDTAMNQSTTYDQTLHYKLGGTIVLALVLVFVLQQSGFRFVVAAGVGGR